MAIDGLTREQYRAFRRHPVAAALFRAAQRGHVVYQDQIDDLRLPDRQRKAFVQALELAKRAQDQRGDERTQTLSQLERGAHAITGSLPADYEDVASRRQRRALEGDPAAIGELEQQSRRLDALAAAVDGGE